MKLYEQPSRYDIFAPSEVVGKYRTLIVNDRRYLGSVYTVADTIKTHQGLHMPDKVPGFPEVKGWNIDAFRVWCAAKGYQLEKF